MSGGRRKKPNGAKPDTAGSVTVAYIHANEATMSWHHSLMELVNYDMGHEGRVMRGGWCAIHAGTGGLVEARNMAVDAFLKDRVGEWLWWVDTDMGFEPDTVDRLFEASDPRERPIVAALCFSLREDAPDGMGGWRTKMNPTIFDWTTEGETRKGFAVRFQYSKNALTQCSGTGSACILIHRSVFQKIEKDFGPIWYNRITNPTTGHLISEDLSFCIRANAAGFPIFVHTGVQASHAKTRWLIETDYDDQMMAEAVRLSLQGESEPAAVIVPVLNRPQNAEPFMRSFRTSNANATVYAVVGNADMASMQAWLKAGAKIIGTNRQTFAEKVNEAYRVTSEPWLLLVGDDVKFHPGWLQAAQKVGKDVVGTNDLGNPRVVAGEHTCHPLIRRSYIEEQGASWDGPGVVAHEGYGHWFVDDEIVTVAKQRSVWGFAKDSIIEHMHPLWKKGLMDETYEIGAAKAKNDKAHFEERLVRNVNA